MVQNEAQGVESTIPRKRRAVFLKLRLLGNRSRFGSTWDEAGFAFVLKKVARCINKRWFHYRKNTISDFELSFHHRKTTFLEISSDITMRWRRSFFKMIVFLMVW